MKMLHACIRVTDLEASLKFYCGVLGLIETRRKEKYEDGFALVYLSDKIGGYEIELTYNVGVESYELGNGFSHFAVESDDITLERQKHMGLGYVVTELKGLSGEKPRFYFVSDPDGYKIEVIQKEG